ncbi:hypothetical protein [Streptomyces sp. ALI-76-A]|uniref:hypothetical protein n=1 Tax=Streptomyces sp. ALI-76-A TaxID=3025736 RepID=UPI00256EF58F|nr:hypothetical protein [Streptomyces sp. ALI-76-A]MDL5205096.1 hypothetical protein [Streptomyces sp. ALI-76-A]
MTNTDPRIRQLAEARQQHGHQPYGSTARWDNLKPDEQQLFLTEATAWLAAAVAAGIAPPAERPTPDHNAVWVDEEGFLYGEYQTSPPTPLAEAAILRLVWASEVCSEKREMEEQGTTFRLLGWSE